jgi:3-hydroxybutyryl-CoA dehydrogenase
MGPFELMDLIGLDVNLATSESVYQRTEADRLEPSQTQRIMVAEGLLGRKTGQGFYSYAYGKAERFEPEAGQIDQRTNADEIVAIVGLGPQAQELAEMIGERYANVQAIANDEMLDELLPGSTMIIDAGDGASDRSEIIAALDASFDKECVIIADAYATNLSGCAQRMRHGERLVGFGALGSVASQSAVEIVNSEGVSDDALELAQELFASIGKGVVLVEDVPGLFLGRTIGSIVNEAMIAVAEDVASPEDVDEAMLLGANYPAGPIAWGREIGGTRIRRILKRLADAEGEQFAPHRSLWLLDVEAAPPQESPQ